MRLAVVAVGAAAVLLLSGCGGGSRATARTSPTPAPVGTHAEGGLVGTIDRARLLSVCVNGRQADPLVQAGMDGTQADTMLIAAADLLVRPPVDAAAAALGRQVRRDVAAHREAAAVTAVASFCHARGG